MSIIRVTLLIFILFSAASVCLTKRLISSIILYTSFSTALSLIWILVIAPDIAITEAAVGTGISGVLFFVLLKRIGVVELEYSEEKREERVEKWSAKSGAKGKRTFFNVMATVICASFTGVLLYTVIRLPGFGNAGNPANNEVPARFIEQGIQDTGVINAVSAMLWSYRSFDTFGEAMVLFVAVCSVFILARGGIASEVSDAFLREMDDPRKDMILKKTGFIMIAIIMIFGFYAVLHGHLSPGGGFSGGAVLGASVILFASTYGAKRAHDFIGYKTFCRILIVSLVSYAAAKFYSFYVGANDLVYLIPFGTPGSLLSGGLIPLLNMAVGITVAGTMYVIYILFAKGDLK
ncbi:MAG: DUF4040 domain-containing protein [Spirochaetes bacterium]|nr:DUF4040 domain-containing protein [Spirochaetota bacterium]